MQYNWQTSNLITYLSKKTQGLLNEDLQYKDYQLMVANGLPTYYWHTTGILLAVP